MKRALTIAGSDPSGGAGIQADLKVFTDLGVFGLSTITAVTAQNSLGVQKVEKVAPRIIAAQIDSVAKDIGIDACKIGMMYAPQAVSTIIDRIRRRSIQNVVLDPMIFAKDGSRLLLSKGVDRMRRALLELCVLVTPNINEAELLAKKSITSLDDVKEAGQKIQGFGAKNVLIKGGHLEGEPIDVLFDGQDFIEFPGKRIDGKSMHGTGCVLSAAITARLALGDTVPAAVGFAKEYVSAAIERSIPLGKGAMWYFIGTQE